MCTSFGPHQRDCISLHRFCQILSKTGSLPLQHAFFSLFSVAQTSCNSYSSIKHPSFNPRPGGARRPEAGAPEKVKPGKPAQRLTMLFSLPPPPPRRGLRRRRDGRATPDLRAISHGTDHRWSGAPGHVTPGCPKKAPALLLRDPGAGNICLGHTDARRASRPARFTCSHA